MTSWNGDPSLIPGAGVHSVSDRLTERGVVMFKEFKEFIAKGSAIDLAVGVVIGAAFGAIVTSLVKDVIMPVVGLLLGGVDFANKFIVLKGGGSFPTLAAAQEAGVPTLNYGLFINAIVAFIIICLLYTSPSPR